MRRLLPRRRDEFIPSLFGGGTEFDFFDRFFRESHYPPADIRDRDTYYEVLVDVPGFSKDDIVVEYKDGYLQIQGTKEQDIETRDEGGHYIRKERSYGSFRRSFYIGEVDEKAITGSFKDGVLSIEVPKSKEEEKAENAHRIRIE